MATNKVRFPKGVEAGQPRQQALANCILEVVEPENPTAGDQVFVEVKCVMTQFDPCFGICAGYTRWEADLLVGGQQIDSEIGVTMCEGDDPAFMSGTITLDAGSHDVVVDGRIEDIDLDSCEIEGWESVSGNVGTINVESPFDADKVSIRSGSCDASPTDPAPGDPVTVEVFVENTNDAPAEATVVWDDQSGSEIVRETREIAATGGRRFEASFDAPASGSVTPVPRLTTASSLAIAGQRAAAQLPGTQN